MPGVFICDALALKLNCGTVMLRKAGKLPGKVLEESYALEYGTARLSVQASRELAGKRVILCDDLLATGGTFSISQTDQPSRRNSGRSYMCY